MIKTFSIKNFQSHLDSQLEFHSNINIISGSSDSGKSSIIRALNLLINNKPNGIDFITYNKKECQIKAEIDNHIIERNKSDKINNYIINGKELTAFGQDMPDEIKQAINFNELNLQLQFDNPFLISESSGEIARILNKVINLEIIDESLCKVEKLKRELKRQIDDCNNLIEQYEKDILKYNWIQDYENKLNKAIEKENQIILKNVKKENLSLKIDKIKQFLIEIKQYEKILKYEDKINNLIEKNKKIEENIKIKNNLKNLILDLKQKMDLKVQINNNILKLEKEYKDKFPNICPLCNQKIEN